MKIFLSTFLAEVNTFSPLQGNMDTFKKSYLVYDGNHNSYDNYWMKPMKVFRDKAEQYDCSVVEAISGLTTPGGKITDEIYFHFRDTILTKISENGPFDIILLHLHGAIISESIDDCEGDLLSAIRQLVGPDVIISVEFDPHANLSQLMCENVDLLLCYKEYPHTDVVEVAEQLFDLAYLARQKNIKPVMSVAYAKMINVFPTVVEPMKGFVSHIKQVEASDPKVLSISVVHGFPWSDVYDSGTKIIVITDNDLQYGQKLAHQLAKDLFRLKDQTMPTFCSISESIKKVEHASGLVVLADFADNAGGGAYSDSTYILEQFLEEGVDKALLGCFWEPEAVEIAKKLGVGNSGIFHIGGKGEYSGKRLQVEAIVTHVVDDYKQAMQEGHVSMGDTCVLQFSGITLVVNSIRDQTFTTNCFTDLGLDLEDYRVIVVKSSTHFRASFQKLTDNLFIVAAPGTLCPDFKAIPYEKVERPIWPLDRVSL